VKTMIVVGLVGRIGAGKSTVAGLFAARGAHPIDADALAHEVLAEPAVVAEVAARFGRGSIDADRVRRAALADLVFGPSAAHAENLRALEAIVHPRVRRRIDALLADLAAAEKPVDPAVVILDVPLLMQAGLAERCGWFVVVECEESVRRARLAARGWSAEQQAARERAWERGYAAPPPGKSSVVDASGPAAYTSEQVGRIWDRLRDGSLPHS